MRVLVRGAWLMFFVGLMSLQSALAQSVVRVDTPLGSFSLELFDGATPVTVQNFVNYVITGRYQDSLLHRLEPGFVIQGGYLRWPEGTDGLDTGAVGPAITNEPGISNLRGTLAMAKVGGDPNSATSQWFINLGDNSELDNSNGGFTVFGRVMGDGMQVVDALAAVQRVNVQGLPFPLPVVNYNGGGTIVRDNLVFTNMTLVSGEHALPNYFDPVSGRVHIRVNGGSAGIAALALRIVQSEPDVRVQADLDSLQPLTTAAAGFAFFVPDSGRLVIPELGINGTVVYRNLEFSLTDPEQLIFTLQSFD